MADAVATITAMDEHMTLYDDGAWVVAGQGDVYCSEHGNTAHDEIAAEHCDHDAPNRPGELPTFDLADAPNFLLNDSRIQQAAAERESIITRVFENHDEF